MLVGVLSDTHGKLPEGVSRVFSGVDHIVHAGDIGSRRVLDELEAMAPVTAVRGNAERDELEWRLTDRAVVTLGGRLVTVVHEPNAVRTLPEGVEVVINGHTHRSRVERVGDILHLNPGSAGMRGRDGRGPPVALLELAEGAEPVARIVDL
jgi:putative phosphoesterase